MLQSGAFQHAGVKPAPTFQTFYVPSMTRIDKTFARLKSENRKAFIPYITAGDPTLNTTLDLVLSLEKAGADVIELGVPFSDPIADGPVIQRATDRALKN